MMKTTNLNALLIITTTLPLTSLATNYVEYHSDRQAKNYIDLDSIKLLDQGQDSVYIETKRTYPFIKSNRAAYDTEKSVINCTHQYREQISTSELTFNGDEI